VSTFPYSIALKSSPYIFDKDFYIYNPNILNKGLNTSAANYSTMNNYCIKRLHEAIEKLSIVLY
jgi:hypothetical protein